MTSYEQLTLAMSGLGLLGGAAGFLTAYFARRKAAKSEHTAQAALQKAADAQAEAAASLSRSADSHSEMAAALREIAAGDPTTGTYDFVRIVEEALNAKVEWAIEERAGADSYRLRNLGNIAAQDVEISVIPPEPAEVVVGNSLGNLGPGKAGIFATSPRLKRVAVRWVESDTRQLMSTELDLNDADSSID